MAEKRQPAPPKGLCACARKLWSDTLEHFEVESAGELEVLRGACVALDRAEAAAELVTRDGLIVEDRFGGMKAHPAAELELRERSLSARLIKQLWSTVDRNDAVESPATRAARRAANARWSKSDAKVVRIDRARAAADGRRSGVRA